MSDPILVSSEFVDAFSAMQAEVQRLARKLDGINGPGISNTNDSLSFQSPADATEPYEPPVFPVIAFRMTSQAIGDQLYVGDSVTASMIQDPTAQFTDGDFGTFNFNNQDIVIANPWEMQSGYGGHSLAPLDESGRTAVGPSIYGAGLVIGITTETPPRRLVWWINTKDETFLAVIDTATLTTLSSNDQWTYTFNELRRQNGVGYTGGSLDSGIRSGTCYNSIELIGAIAGTGVNPSDFSGTQAMKPIGHNAAVIMRVVPVGDGSAVEFWFTAMNAVGGVAAAAPADLTGIARTISSAGGCTVTPVTTEPDGTIDYTVSVP